MPPFDMARQNGELPANLAGPCGACAVRGLTICSAMDADDLSLLAEIVQIVRLDAHENLFHEGEPADHLFNVTSGTVKLFKLLPDGRRQITGFMITGDFLGLSVNETYSYTAEAVTDVTLCRFPRHKLDRLTEQYPRLQRRLFAMASNELVAAQDQMLLLGRKSAREKICSFLVTLADRAIRRGQIESPVHMPMSRSDIADYLGLTTETVSRTITQLKTAGLIQLQPSGRVQLNDLEALRGEAEGI